MTTSDRDDKLRSRWQLQIVVTAAGLNDPIGSPLRDTSDEKAKLGGGLARTVRCGPFAIAIGFDFHNQSMM